MMHVVMFLVGFGGSVLLSLLVFALWFFELSVTAAPSLINKVFIGLFTLLVVTCWVRLFSSFDIALII